MFFVEHRKLFINVGGNSANGTASRDSGLGMESGDQNNFSYANFPAAFLAGLSNGFPGFPFGFPAQGLGQETGEEARMSSKSKMPSFMDTGFMSGGNIDFMKMAALVRLGERLSKKIRVSIFHVIKSRKKLY